MPNASPRIALLATGNELTEGDILNTNGQAIAQALTDHQLLIGLHVVVSDAEQDIEDGLNFLLQKHDVVIITGGLGPTSDDRTRYVLSHVIGKPLIFDEQTWQAICARYQKFKLPGPHESNRQQALFPENTQIIINPNGTAAGCRAQHDEKIIYMLPGPPSECLSMFREAVLPELISKQHKPGRKKYSWRLLGAIESEIAALVDEITKPYPVTTGYRIEYPYVQIKIYAKPFNELENLLATINTLLKPYLISDDNRKISELLKETITNFSGLITIYDNVTYGRLESLLLTPETYPHLRFNNNHSNDLHIELNGLTDYWRGKPPTGKTNLQLTFTRNGKSENTETTVPFRNQAVVNYATEYIAKEIWRFLTTA